MPMKLVNPQLRDKCYANISIWASHAIHSRSYTAPEAIRRGTGA